MKVSRYSAKKKVTNVTYSYFVKQTVAERDHHKTMPHSLEYLTREEKGTDVNMAL